MIRNFLCLFLMLASFLSVYATHNRAGEITYKHVSGLTYEITVVTYTKQSSPADRPNIPIDWGDNSPKDSLPRVSDVPLGNDIKKNVYRGEHTYPAPSPAPYILQVEDPNRNGGVQNIPNSVSIPFYIESVLYINPFQGYNNSPELLNPPIDNGCVGATYIHNPGATDIDGDSLYYTLVESKRDGGQAILGYSLPPTSSSIFVDGNTGDFFWNAPVTQGEFNVGILIEEFRNGQKIGSILRDMQITIGACSHQPPVIQQILDTCVIAGGSISFLVDAEDADPSQKVTLTSSSGLYSLGNSPATFIPPTIPSSQVQGAFGWNTNCSHVQLNPYTVFFKAQDDGSPNLVDFETVNIRVIGPKPENLVINVLGDAAELSWDASACGQVEKYAIYRRKGVSGWSPFYCETGVAASAGFQLVDEVIGHQTIQYLDDNQGLGLTAGETYCYRVVALFPDGSESKASDEICATLKKDIPVITHVSVDQTGVGNGEMYIEWSKPTDFDTLVYPGPYRYVISRNELASGPFLLIDSTFSINDTLYTNLVMNTKDNGYFYKVELYSLAGGVRTFVGRSSLASSVFLGAASSDRQITLSWSATVPWTIDSFVVYRQDPLTLVFDSIGITEGYQFVDKGLINGETYCYKVKSIGKYSSQMFVAPLLNWSQELCAVPFDDVAPCQPTLRLSGDCERGENLISWSTVNYGCYYDVQTFELYKNDSLDGDFNLIDTFAFSAVDTSFVHNTPISIAGCYYLQAIDTAGNVSERSDTVCVDNCPEYNLPNIFSPNGDGVNDVFYPFPFKYIVDINFTIYDRWGNLVFETTDPNVGWDGVSKTSQKRVNDGVYYYIAVINSQRLEGLEPIVKKGFIHIFSK